MLRYIIFSQNFPRKGGRLHNFPGGTKNFKGTLCYRVCIQSVAMNQFRHLYSHSCSQLVLMEIENQ